MEQGTKASQFSYTTALHNADSPTSRISISSKTLEMTPKLSNFSDVPNDNATIKQLVKPATSNMLLSCFIALVVALKILMRTSRLEHLKV